MGGRYWSPLSGEQWVRWGSCLPAACSARDAQVLLSAALHLDLGLDLGLGRALEPLIHSGARISVSIPDRSCQDSAPKPFQGIELVVM